MEEVPLTTTAEWWWCVLKREQANSLQKDRVHVSSEVCEVLLNQS